MSVFHDLEMSKAESPNTIELEFGAERSQDPGISGKEFQWKRRSCPASDLIHKTISVSKYHLTGLTLWNCE